MIFGNIRKASNFFVKVATSLMISDNLWVVFVGRSTRPWYCTDFLWTVFQPNVSLSQKVRLQISRGRLQSRDNWHATGPTIVISEHVKTHARYTQTFLLIWLVRKTYTSNEFDHLRSGVLLDEGNFFGPFASKTNAWSQITNSSHLQIKFYLFPASNVF